MGLNIDLADGEIITAIAADSEGAESDEVTCKPGNKAPEISLECEMTENPTEYLFTATVSDPDDDPTTVTWFLNGTEITGAEDLILTIVLGPGDVVSAVATDQYDAVSAADTCVPGNQAPEVNLVCEPTATPGRYRYIVTGTDPDGEAPGALRERVLAFAAEQREHKHRDIALVTHAGVIKVLVGHVEGLADKDWLALSVGFGSLTRLSID